MAEETAIEKAIKCFVLRRTGDDVYLDLGKSDCICVKHRSKRGSIVLATMWVNVLQHNNNFPVNRYPYRKCYDASGNYKIILRVDDIKISVFMCTGTLMMQGSFVLQWFMRNFESILIAFSLPRREPRPLDDEFCKYRDSWNEINFQRKLKKEQERQREREKEDEAINMALNDVARERETYENVEEVNNLQANIRDFVDEVEIMDVDMLTGNSLQRQLEKLHVGCVKDGPTFVYKIWKSLLNKWFSEENCQVFIATPFLDADRLEDICQLVMKNRLTASLDALYVRRDCDRLINISDIKRETQIRFQPKDQVFIEYKIYSSIIYPLARFHSKFIAGVKDGKAQVLVTSANFHSDHFVHPNAESVLYIEMSEEEFVARFLKLMTPSVTV